MKKLFVLVFVAVLSQTALYSEENFDYSKFNGVSLGAGATVTSDISGGFFHFGFSFYSKDTTKGNFSIRNYIEVMGGGYLNGGVFGFRERIVFGGIGAITDSFAIRGYGGIDFGVSFFDGQGTDKEFFDTPLLLEPRGFGGLEFLFAYKNGSKSGSTFIEAGGGSRFSTKDGAQGLPSGIAGGVAFINFGGRVYF